MSLPNKCYTYLKKHKKKVVVFVCISIAYYFCLPNQLFTTPTSTVITSNDGTLIGAKIASDGQWRFPLIDSVPTKFKTCLLQFEDAYFAYHPGFNPISMSKAIGTNFSAGSTKRGASTITQQVIRLMRKQQDRSYWEKGIELILATRLELGYSKKEILQLYTSYAPFGGNVVGLEAATWRYYGQQPHQLSWAEAATMAVLPNAPSLIYPGRNQTSLLRKRNRLLKKLYANALIDSTTYQLSLLEELPQKPFPLPQIAPHLVAHVAKTNAGEKVNSTIDKSLQKTVNTIVNKHYLNLKQNQVHNAAVLVLEVKTKKVLAYVGNTNTTVAHQKYVDMAQANRSTGSTIKPLLYAAMLDAGELLPGMLIPDIPTQISGYSPENFNEKYMGAVPANLALAQSLNIPAVRLLQGYGLGKFRDQLNVFNLRGLNKSADHYGLTLILGGAETNLWDLCKTYAGLAGTINHFNETSSEYFTTEFTNPIVNTNQVVDFGIKTTKPPIFDAASVYLTFDALKAVNRPEIDTSWEYYDSAKEIAWKTGTSFGNKDAWAIGSTKDYVVGVWVGNADGEGRPNVTGVTSAAPVLFDVFNVLPTSTWFQKPLDEFVEIEVCADSGFLPSVHCPKRLTEIPNKANYVGVCKYHHLIQLDDQNLRVNANCADLASTTTKSWFVLPPLMEYFYRKFNPNYKTLPALKADCQAVENVMEFIYPKNGSKITLVKNFSGELNEIAVKVVHPNSNAALYWYLDEQYLGETTTFHEMGIVPKPGQHHITVVDAVGNEAVVQFSVE